MDWQKEIERFSHLDPAGTGMFAPPREMEQAIATYNKAVDLLGLDSFDIALIALKRLAASYPMFAQAAMLLGCCQMLLGQYDEAAEHFDHARLLDMIHDEHELAEQYLYEAKKQQELQEQLLIQDQRTGRSDKNKVLSKTGIFSKKKQQDELEQLIPESDIPNQSISSIPNTGAPILQPTGRKQRVRMASEKERQDVIRRAEFPEEEETFIVYDKDIFDYLRKILPVGLIVLAVAALIWGGLILADFISDRNDGPDVQDRLEWLETRLGDMADDNDDVLALLQAYNSFINPTDIDSTTTVQEATESGSVETTTAEPTTKVTTTAVTESTLSQEELDKQKLELAFAKYSEAFEMQNNDSVAAAIILQELKINIADIPDGSTFTTQAPNAEDEATISSEQLKSDVDSLFSTVAVRAADSLRLTGRALFDQRDFEAALEDYLLAFKLDPGNYRGNVAYYCGRSYQELERFDEAKPYFEYVMENFPNSELAGYAANRLAMMGF